MTDPKSNAASTADLPDRAGPDLRPAYERPRVVKKKAVTRATLFTGGGPTSAPPLVSSP